FSKNHDPFGFKLNARLDILFADIVSYAISMNDFSITFVLRRFSFPLVMQHLLNPQYSVLAGFLLGFGGVLALVRDFIELFTFHIYILHMLFSVFHCVEISTMITLGRLLQGKKWNVLRYRVDHEHFSSSQVI